MEYLVLRNGNLQGQSADNFHYCCLFICLHKTRRMLRACTVLSRVSNALPNFAVVLNGRFIHRVSRRLFLVAEYAKNRRG